MNKIVESKLVDDVIKLKVITKKAIVNSSKLTIHVNECNNKHMICDNPEYQDYVFDDDNSTITLNRVVEEENEEITVDYKYYITIQSDIISELNNTMKYVKIYCTTEEYANDAIEGILYDPSVIYEAEVRMLNCYCDCCLDDKQMQRIMHIVFKRQLLEDAIASGNNIEAITHYKDLCRMLNIHIRRGDCQKEVCNTNKCCSNGQCCILG